MFQFEHHPIPGRKTHSFAAKATRPEAGLSWLMFVASSIGPYSGESCTSRVYAPDKIKRTINQYAFETQRHFGILDAPLAKQIRARRHVRHR